MGTKRIGLGRTEALIENLKREILLGAGSSMAGGRLKVTSLSNSAAAIVLTGADALTEANYPSGTLFSLDLADTNNDAAITLPALTAGLKYEFMVQTNAGANVGLTISGPGANVLATSICSNGIQTAAGTNLVFTDQKAVAGTYIKAECDGTKWILNAYCPGATKAQVTI